MRLQGYCRARTIQGSHVLLSIIYIHLQIFPFQSLVRIFHLSSTLIDSRFFASASMYYRNSYCAVVVYDITLTASLEKARTWIPELQRQADPSIVIALCGNKTDLAARRQVTQEEAKKYAEEEGLMWGETSA